MVDTVFLRVGSLCCACLLGTEQNENEKEVWVEEAVVFVEFDAGDIQCDRIL